MKICEGDSNLLSKIMLFSMSYKFMYIFMLPKEAFKERVDEPVGQDDFRGLFLF